MAIEEEREKGEGRRECEFKWPSQDNSKNAFKRKSVKEFRLWPTDCVEWGGGLDCRQGVGQGKTAIEAAQFESAPDSKTKNSVCTGRENGTGNGKCDCRQRDRG